MPNKTSAIRLAKLALVLAIAVAVVAGTLVLALAFQEFESGVPGKSLPNAATRKDPP